MYLNLCATIKTRDENRMQKALTALSLLTIPTAPTRMQALPSNGRT